MPKFNPIKNGYIPTPPTCNSKKKEKEKKGLLSLKKRKKNKNKNKNKNKRNNNYANCGSISPTAAAAAAESNNIDEIKEEDRIFQLMPSKTGGVESTFPESLDQLTQEAIAMKNRLSTHTITNSNLSQFLLHSLEYVIYMVSTYCNETKLPPFNWETMEFPKKVPKSRLKISSQDVRVVDNTFKLAENAFKLSECGRVLPDLDSHGSKTVKAYACIPHPWYLNRKLPQPVDLFLNREGKKIWLEFKEFDKGNPEAEGTITCLCSCVGLDHPIVSVIGDFVVAAFNEACQMHVKRDEHNNLHDFEFMECKYLRLPEVYYFYMTIEAIEEGNLGVYESQVVCSSDGNVLTLTKFVLTGRKPNGTKAMAISIFSFLRFVCKTLEGVTEEKTSDLCKILDVIDGARGHGFPMHKLCLVSELHTDTIKGLHQLLTLGHHLLFSSDCSRTTNPDVWSHPDNESRSGMVHRTEGTPCRGYDYQHPLFRGSGHYEKPICVWWCCPDANIG